MLTPPGGCNDRKAVEARYAAARDSWCEMARADPAVLERVVAASSTMRQLWRAGQYTHWDDSLGRHGQGPLTRRSNPAALAKALKLVEKWGDGEG